MKIKTIFLIISLVGVGNTKTKNYQRHPDVGLNVKQLIIKYGYPFESHIIVTDDGYILELHRIPHGRKTTKLENQAVVLLMPGILSSSADWVNTGPEKGLGYILADNGYDVWLGNYRGSTWSKRHVKLDPEKNKTEYWNFGFTELGYYDLPAKINYILFVTQQDKLFYIGFSQGTLTFFVMTSTRPEYNDKIRLMSALAPVLHNENMQSVFFRYLATILKPFEKFVEKYELYEFLPHGPLLPLLGQIFCNDDSPLQDLCASVLFVLAGYSPLQLNKTMIPVIASNTPAGACTKQFIHFTQQLVAKKFQDYDYGEGENLIKYGQPTPPVYDISKITAPLAFYYSDNDYLCSNIDVERAASELSNVVELNLISGWNHLDFMYAIDVPLLYNRLLEVMENY